MPAMAQLTFHLKSVIFDMDGVITNTMPDHFHAWKVTLQKYDIHVSHYDIYSREGQRGIRSVEELFMQFNKLFNERQALKILAEKEEYFKSFVKQRFVMGTRNFLKSLHRRGVRLALVTGTSRHELHRILPEHLYNLFCVVVTGNDVHHGKPHPEPYLKAIEKLDIKKNEAVVIENAPFGIQSAKDAGLTCLALETSLPKKHLSRADHIFPSVKELQRKVSFKVKV